LRIELHRLEPRVRGLEHDLAAAPAVGLDRRLLAGDSRHHDVALVGRRLRADDDIVAVEDPGVDHRVAAHADHEELAVAGEVRRERQQLLHVLLREHVGASGDVAHERDVTRGPALDGRARVGVVAHLERPRLGGVAAQEAQPLQREQVGVDRRR
jgi:hypothetical protein